MKVVWTEPALNDLSEIGYFIAQDSPDRAQTLIAVQTRQGGGTRHSSTSDP